MTRYCPYCRAPLYQRMDKDGKYVYACMGCKRTYSLKEATRLPKQSLKFRRTLRDAERAYESAMKILRNLDKGENRLIVANALVRAGCTDVKASDLEGAKLDPLSERRPELSRRYGIRIYPMTIVVHPKKADALRDKVYGTDSRKSIRGTSVISVREWPFGQLGGIRLSFNPAATESKTAEHEDLHGSWSIYRGYGNANYTVEQLHEARILDEINSFRSGLRYAKSSQSGDRARIYHYWKGIETVLIEKYVPRITEHMDADFGRDARKYESERLEELIREIIPVMAGLEMRYDQRVITRIIIKSRDIEEFKWWVKRKNILDEWQEKAITGRENDLKKFITQKMDFLVDLEIIKRDAYNEASEYWRFRGKPGDSDAMREYVNRMVEEVLEKCDDDIKDYYKKRQEEGKKGLEKLAEKVKEEDEKRTEKGKKGLRLLIKKTGEEDRKSKERGKKGLRLLVKKTKNG